MTCVSPMHRCHIPTMHKRNPNNVVLVIGPAYTAYTRDNQPENISH